MEGLLNFFESYILSSKDVLFASNNIAIDLVLACAVIFLFIYWWRYGENKKYKLPPGPRGLPILGYLPFLTKEPFRDFDNLCKKYGKVISIYLGRTHIVILGSFEAVKEAFSKTSTLDRPENLFDFLPDEIGLGSTNGVEWVEQRRFAVKAMRDLGLGRSKWERLVQEEVDDFIKLLHSFGGKPFDVFQYITLSVSNNISSLVFGKRLPHNDENLKFLSATLEKLFKFFAPTTWRNYFPVLHDTLSKLGISSVSESRELFVAFNDFIKKEVKLQKETYTPGSTDNFVHEYLTEMNKQDKNSIEGFNERNLIGNVQAFYLGGSDTTSLSLSWLWLLMAKYPDIQKKVHQEIDSVLGKEGKIQYAERAKLPFTFAVIMEGQRYRTLAPINTSRKAVEDIKVQGFDIPKGTVIIANNWGQHHDTRYWKEPESFVPERFLSIDGKIANFKPESYVPFSYGKRGCPAETVAMIEILVYFTAVMQNFHVLPPENKTPLLDGSLGLTYQVLPQELRFISRG